MANQRMYVIDSETASHCSLWKTGEIAIGGVRQMQYILCVVIVCSSLGIGVARGYWAAPEKTADRFKQWGGEDLYMTGESGISYWKLKNANQQVILGDGEKMARSSFLEGDVSC